MKNKKVRQLMDEYSKEYEIINNQMQELESRKTLLSGFLEELNDLISTRSKGKGKGKVGRPKGKGKGKVGRPKGKVGRPKKK